MNPAKVIGTSEWFEAIDPKYRHVAQAWLLGAKHEFKSPDNPKGRWTVSGAKVSTWQNVSHYYENGAPFEAGFKYRISPPTGKTL